MQSEMKFMLLTESSRSPPATHIGSHICNVISTDYKNRHIHRDVYQANAICLRVAMCLNSPTELQCSANPRERPRRGELERKWKEEESLKSRSDSTTTPPPRQWTHAPIHVGQGAFLQPASDPSALAGRVCHCARVTPELQSTRGFPPRGRSTQTHHSSGSENSDLLWC